MTIERINSICADRYGCGILAIDSVTALWLAEHILIANGDNVYRAISEHRHKYGLATAFPEYGSELFNSLEFSENVRNS